MAEQLCPLWDLPARAAQCETVIKEKKKVAAIIQHGTVNKPMSQCSINHNQLMFKPPVWF